MKELKWEQRVPIFKNSLILKQLGIAIGIPFGILIIFLTVSQAYYALMLIGAMFVLAFLLILIIFRATYDVSYTLNGNEILCKTQAQQSKRVKRLSKFTFLLGLLNGNPSVAGAGLLSASRTETRLTWEQIRRIKYKDKQNTIYLHGKYGNRIVLFCSKQNYMEIKQYIIKVREED